MDGCPIPLLLSSLHVFSFTVVRSDPNKKQNKGHKHPVPVRSLMFISFFFLKSNCFRARLNRIPFLPFFFMVWIAYFFLSADLFSIGSTFLTVFIYIPTHPTPTPVRVSVNVCYLLWGIDPLGSAFFSRARFVVRVLSRSLALSLSWRHYCVGCVRLFLCCDK